MAVAGVSANRLELLTIADAVAREKNIDKEIVVEAIEEAIQKGAKSRYGAHHDIRAKIDRKSGDVELARFREVVETVENDLTQMSVPHAQRLRPGIAAGEFVIERFPRIDLAELGRIAAQTAKQVIVQKVREAERDRQFGEFKDRVGEIVREYGSDTVLLIGGSLLIARERLAERSRAFVAAVHAASDAARALA